MKTLYFKLIILLTCITIIPLIYSCKSPSYVFYHSEASIPQESKTITTEFQLMKLIKEKMPFGVIAAIDKNMTDEISEYYIILSPPLEITMYIYSVENYIHNYHVFLKPEKVNELVKNIDKGLDIIRQKKDTFSGTNFEYIVSKEQSIQQLSTNVESWNPDFKFICKSYKENSESFVKLGFIQTEKGSIYFSYFLDKDQLIELKGRLIAAIEKLKSWGME